MPGETGGVSRRRVLRCGVVLGGTAAGLIGASGGALATCRPRTAGYWANHEWPATGVDRVNAVVFAPSGSSIADADEGRAFLKEPPRGDKGQILARQLVATVLNFQYADGGDDACVRQTISELEDLEAAGFDSTVVGLKRAATRWLATSAFPDSVDDWDVPAAPYSAGEWLKDGLDRFNNDRLAVDCEVQDCPLPGENTTSGGGNGSGGNGNGGNGNGGNGNGNRGGGNGGGRNWSDRSRDGGKRGNWDVGMRR